jgi:hypothetical protein
MQRSAASSAGFDSLNHSGSKGCQHSTQHFRFD